MSTLRQIEAVTGANLRSIPERYKTSLVLVLGVAATVAVLVSVLAVATGLGKTLVVTGRSDRVVLLESVDQFEVASRLDRRTASVLQQLPGIRLAGDGTALASPEAIASVWLQGPAGSRSSIALRGLGLQGLALRPEIRIVAGQVFRPGLREVIVGKSVQARFAQMSVGSDVVLDGVAWRIVGSFTSGADAHESEILTDSDTLLGAYNRAQYNSVVAALDGPNALATVRDALAASPALVVSAILETQYYQRQSEQLAAFMVRATYAVCALMALGAMFGALNTMYSAVRVRTLEIAVLRALGFGSLGVVISVFVEGLILSLIGAMLGALLAWLFFDGNLVSTMSGANGLNQVVFHVDVGVSLVLTGVLWAMAVGALGALFPAVRAARLPVAAALRE